MSMLLIVLFLISVEDVRSHNSSDTYELFKNFNSFEKIRDYLRYLEAKYPEKVTLEEVGTSRSNLNIRWVKLSLEMTFNKTGPKSVILIDAGIHGREWMGPAVATYLIHQLVEYEENEYLLYNIDWYIIPILNPDGYIYSMTNEKTRSWAKNKAEGRICVGVDINRNFDYQWGLFQSENIECSDTYGGPEPFSEPETRTLRKLALKYQRRIRLYVSLQAWGEKLMYPWTYINRPVALDFEEEHKYLGEQVVNAMNSVNGAKYQTGRYSSIHEASGTSIDWMSAVAQIPLCYILQINNAAEKYHPPKSQILPTAKEIFAAFKEFHKYVEYQWMPRRDETIIEDNETLPSNNDSDTTSLEKIYIEKKKKFKRTD